MKTYAVITKKKNKTTEIRKITENSKFDMKNPEYLYAAEIDVPDGIEWPDKFRTKKRIENFEDCRKFLMEMYDAQEETR